MSSDKKKRSGKSIAGNAAGNFPALYAGGSQVLFNLAARILHSSEEAENAVTEVYLSTWREASDIVESGSDPTDLLLARTRDLVTRRRNARPDGRDYRPVDLESLAKNLSAKRRDGKAVSPVQASLEPCLRGAIGRCGSVTTAAVSHLYFGGLTVAETAEVLSMTENECRSRVHGFLDMIATRCGLGRSAGHHQGFPVLAAAQALGAHNPHECPEYMEHLADGCTRCAAEIKRLSRAAGKLSYLLPDVKLPPELAEKISFSLQLASVVAGAQDEPEPDIPEPAETDAVPEPVPVPGPSPDRGSPRAAYGSAVRILGVLAGAALFVACGLVVYTSSLRDTIGRQSDLIESVQSKNTELLVQYDRLAGVSGFFESEGVVAILEGDGSYPGLTGKLVWDTAGKSAMLQILNFPPVLAESELEVSAVRGGRRERVAGLRPAGAAPGSVVYRFFPVDAGNDPIPSEFTVAAVADDGRSGKVYRNIMNGSIPDRHPAPATTGRE